MTMQDRRAQLEEIAEMALRAAVEAEAAEQFSAMASLLRERRAALNELAGLPVAQEVSKADELRARREARKANDPASTARRGQSRRSNGSHRTG